VHGILEQRRYRDSSFPGATQVQRVRVELGQNQRLADVRSALRLELDRAYCAFTAAFAASRRAFSSTTNR
jgi:hypothetical protein